MIEKVSMEVGNQILKMIKNLDDTHVAEESSKKNMPVTRLLRQLLCCTTIPYVNISETQNTTNALFSVYECQTVCIFPSFPVRPSV